MHPFIQDVMRKDEKMQQSPEGPLHNVTMQCAGYMLVQIINNKSAATGVQCSVVSEGAVAVSWQYHRRHACMQASNRY